MSNHKYTYVYISWFPQNYIIWLKRISEILPERTGALKLTFKTYKFNENFNFVNKKSNTDYTT